MSDRSRGGHRGRGAVSRGWFRLGNVILDRYGGELGPVGIAVYAAVARRVGSNAAGFPSYRDIARLAGVDRSTAMRAMKRLEALGLVTVTGRRDAGGQHSNLYRLTPIEQVVAQGNRSTTDTGDIAPPGGGPAPPETGAVSPRGGGGAPPEEDHMQEEEGEGEGERGGTSACDARTPKKKGVDGRAPLQAAAGSPSLSPPALAVDDDLPEPAYPHVFESLWALFPRRGGKARAYAAWRELGCAGDPALRWAISAAAMVPQQWTRADGRPVQLTLEEWLHHRPWESPVEEEREEKRGDG